MTKSKKTTETELNTYLIWVGSEHYSTIDAWTTEAMEMGVSKRLPNEAMGHALMKPNTVVLVAHDEGNFRECTFCEHEIECGECRKSNVLLEKLEAQRVEAAKALHFASERATALAPGLKKRLDKIVAKKHAIEIDIDNCDECLGAQVVMAGSGGKVEFNNGETWDYRKYNYWLHQPKIWSPAMEDGIAVCARCEECGGTGKRSVGVVFGMFIPEVLELVVSEAVGYDEPLPSGVSLVPEHVVKAEKVRGCGRRKRGGFYVRTEPTEEEKVAKHGSVPTAMIKGNFGSFLSRYDIGAKRFRGLKRFPIETAELRTAVLDVLDAIKS